MTFGLLTILVGALALWAALQISRTIQASRDWPTVPGMILERGVGARMGRISHAPHVKYAYSVGGKDYVNDQFYLAVTIGRSAKKIRQLIDALPDPVPVHYDPVSPGRSYLLVTPTSTVWVFGAAGVAALVLGFVQLVVTVTSYLGRL